MIRAILVLYLTTIFACLFFLVCCVVTLVVTRIDNLSFTPNRVRALLKVFCQQSNGLNICNLNARSLRSKIDELSEIFVGSDVHVILVSETWLRSEVPSALVTLPGYKLFRNDRLGRVGGGVAIYVRECLSSRFVSCSRSSFLEFLCVEVNSGAEKCLLSSVYCPPTRFTTENAEEFLDTFSNLTHRYSNIVIGGDFNVNVLRSTSLTDSFLFFLQSLNLIIVNELPTYFNTSNPSLLDLFVTTDRDAVSFFNQLSPPSSFDHDFIFLTYNINIGLIHHDKTVTYRDYRRINLSQLENECSSLPWERVTQCISIDDQVNTFNEFFHYLHDKYAPLQSRRIKENGCPWFSADIKSLIAERDFLYRRYLRVKTVESRAQYNIIRNLVNSRVRAAKKQFYMSKFNPQIPSKTLWKNLRKAGTYGKDEPYCDLDPNFLNSHFTTLPTHVSVNFPSPHLNDLSSTHTGFSFKGVDALDTIWAVNSVKSDAIGPDGISPKFFKIIFPWIIRPVLHIFNSCLTTSRFPSLWKAATVVPIAKSRNPRVPSDFRPISLLCFLSKALEKLMAQQIVHFVENNSLLNPYQSGFRKSHSCETALLDVTTHIRSSLDRDHLCALALLDFSKAFDMVNHSKLVDKLVSNFRFESTAIAFINSFLSGRSQRVKVKDRISGSLPLVSGVPQGSILGPLLFSLYIDDLANVVHECNIHLYADDVQVYLSRPIGLVEDCIDRLNSDLMNISVWATANGLLLNPQKSQCIAFYRRMIDRSALPPVILNNTILPFTNRVKNLGIFLNYNMKCCDHVGEMVGKIYGGLRRLWLFSGVLSVNTRLMLVKTLLLPYFTNGFLLFPHLDSICSRKINVAFNDCIRFVFGLRRFDHVSPFGDSLLGCPLKLYLLRRILIFLHKIIYTKKPPYLFNQLEFLSSSRRFDLLIPRFHYSVMEDSYFVRASRAWNNLTSEVQRVSSTGRFGKLIKQFNLPID